jgi:hypothetical protein
MDKQSNSRRSVLKTAGAVTTAAIAGCTSEGGEEGSDDQSDDADVSNTETQENPEQGSNGESLEEKYPDYFVINTQARLVALSDIQTDANSVTVTISGTVVNESSTNYDYVQIEFGLYGESGAKVGTALDNLSGLASGERWRYEAVGTSDGVSRWELDTLTGY